MSDRTVTIICLIVILCWLPGNLAWSVMEFVTIITPEDSTARMAFLPIIMLSGWLGMVYSFIMVSLHLAVLTIAASAACLIFTLYRCLRRGCRWELAGLALIALVGHLAFLQFPNPPGSTWLQSIGLW